MSGPHVVVCVLGDLGRSSRILRHAECLLRRRAAVTLLGFVESEIPPSVAAARLLRVNACAALRRRRTGLLGPAAAVVRQALLAAGLLAALLRGARRGSVLLVQVPPLVALPVALLAARMRGGRVVCDWHNESAPLVAQRHGPGLAARAVGLAERRLARAGVLHVAVSHALAARLGGGATVLHDLPSRLGVCAIETGTEAVPTSDSSPAGAHRLEPLGFEVAAGLHREALAAPRPAAAHALVVAPSSFGLDDDFALLAEAAAAADRELSPSTPLVIALTGRGERRAEVERAIDGLRLRNITVVTAWLDDAGYRALLASADAGLSLHRSASGTDLPIKLVEMAGCGTPIVALDYGGAVREVIGSDATYFRTAAELAAILVHLARDPEALPPPPTLPDWDDVWSRVLWPLIV